MIECRKYNSDDYYEVASWWEARKIHMAEDLLPKTGFIIPGVAAGFLMKTDTGAAIIEPFIANPNKSKAERDRALNAIVGNLIEEARHLGFSRIFGFSSHERMIERVLKYGFIIVEESTTVVKELI